MHKKTKNDSKAAMSDNGKAKAVNLTLTGGVLTIVAACMKHRVISNRSEYISTLIREDWERRGRPV